MKLLFQLIIKGIPIILFLNYFRFYLEKHEEYKQFILWLSYKAINVYSRGQILFGKVIDYANRTIQSYPPLKKIRDDIIDFYKKSQKCLDSIEYIKDYEVVGKYPINYDSYYPVDFDFVIVSYHDNGTVYKRIFNSPEKIVKTYEITDIQFMLIEFYINDKSYVINLKDKNTNYYLVDNKIDFRFALYYIAVNYSEKITMKQLIENTKDDDNDKNKIYIKIIDQNVNILKITTPNECIIFKKDGYVTF